MSAISLLPCPFCGKDNPIITQYSTGAFAVSCGDCGALGPVSDEYPQDAAEAVQAWNRRTP